MTTINLKTTFINSKDKDIFRSIGVLDKLMAFVPPPLTEIARVKIIDGAAHITAQQAGGPAGKNEIVGTQAVVLSFWKGSPDPSRDLVRQALEQMGLWQYVAAAGMA